MTIARWADLPVLAVGLHLTVFGLMCGSEHGPLGSLLHAAVPGLLIVAVAWLAWHRPIAGGAATVVLGAAAWLSYGRTTNPLVLTLVFVPLLAAGTVMLWAGLARRQSDA